MRIVYYTSGVSGSGRLVRGISIGNALRRGGLPADLTLLSSSPFGRLAETLGFRHVEIPAEPEHALTPESYADSAVFQALQSLRPDILLIDLLWFPLHHFIHELPCRKVFLWQTLDERFFHIELPQGTLHFRPESYDLVLAIEPFSGPGPRRQVNPLVLRNREEILPRPQALEALGLDEARENWLLSYNGRPGEFERLKIQYEGDQQATRRLVCSTNYQGGLFPAVDYFNAFERVICGAGYNSFWEIVYFEKDAVLVPVQAQFVDPMRLIREYRHYRFRKNGADQLVQIILNL